MSEPAPGSAVVGFDLDMTLIDSRPGVRAVYAALAAETGATIDARLAASRLGPPVELELAHWFPEAEVPAMAERYRALYPGLAPQRIDTLPGAHEALAAVHALGWRSLVITAKNQANALLHVEHLALAADDLVGDAWRGAKAEVLREHDALAYVGDHVHDMEAARGAEVVGIAVATGPCSPEELREAGADVVLEDLTGLPAVLADLARRRA